MLGPILSAADEKAHRSNPAQQPPHRSGFRSWTSRILAEARLSHGLYVTLASDRLVDEQQARDAADEMARDLTKSGLPLRHAGSFGFDFGAAEWFHHSISNRFAVRIAVADLPTAIWDQVSHAVVEWWSRRFGGHR